VKLRRRSLPCMTESAMIDNRRKLEEVGNHDKDAESMAKENSVRYLRMN
jgi:hypothetical protein